MFDSHTYIQRRARLKKDMSSGIILFLGNTESPMNYPANVFRFRQDSSFLYFWGLDEPGLSAIIDIDEDREIIFGNDVSIDDIIWTGPLPTMKEKSGAVGVKETLPVSKLNEIVTEATGKGKKVHFLPQYRADNSITIGNLLNMKPEQIKENVSEKLIKAVVSQRSIKSAKEIEQIEQALDTAYEMHTTAMKITKPGIYEREVAGVIEGIASSKGSGTSFPIIFSIHGEILHNPYHENLMKEGNIAINDSGAESLMHYASDITRTIPVGGKFTQKQKDIYEIVLNAQMVAIHAMKPGIMFRDVHMLAVKTIAKGLNNLGLMSGDIDEAVEQGAHAMFMPHGLGHMMGLDVHDMEALGEDYVGYDETVQRSKQFGKASLRMAKALQKGHVMTVEPGIYFVPDLIDQWKAAGKFTEFINYNAVEEFRNAGGIRIEDDVLVTENGHRVLGKPIPKAVEDVEMMCAG